MHACSDSVEPFLGNIDKGCLKHFCFEGNFIKALYYVKLPPKFLVFGLLCTCSCTWVYITHGCTLQGVLCTCLCTWVYITHVCTLQGVLYTCTCTWESEIETFPLIFLSTPKLHITLKCYIFLELVWQEHSKNIYLLRTHTDSAVLQLIFQWTIYNNKF